MHGEQGVDLRRVGPTGAVGSLVAGISLALRAPSLRRQLVLLLVLNAVLFACVLVGLIAAALWASNAVASGQNVVLASLTWLVGAALVVGAVVMTPSIFQGVSAILLIVLRERFFREARAVAGGPPAPPLGRGALLRVGATETRRLARLIAISLVLLPLHLVPGFGSVAYVVLQVLVSSNAMAWDLLSLHFELHDVPYAAQKAILSRSRITTLALGGTATLLALIPIAQILFLTTNVVGAGILSARLDGASAAPR